MQAWEYSQAAQVVSLVTKPVLQYYSCMSLALAEILLKQTGESSLDRAREHHRHHGLTFGTGPSAASQRDVADVASNLRAKPALRETERFGTFELWHRSSREMPIVGLVTNRHASGTSITRQGVIFSAFDVPLEKVPLGGMSLLTCLTHLPGMAETMAQVGVSANILRGRVALDVLNDVPQTTAITIHPGNADLFRQFQDSCVFHPGDVDKIDFREVGSAGLLSWRADLNEAPGASFPPATTLWEDEVRFWTELQPLNEFGYIYVALFILGNYARYYPDKWITDVETNTPLAYVAEELLHMSEARMPLLTLSELSRIYHLPAT
jgi:hypothetical protein